MSKIIDKRFTDLEIKKLKLSPDKRYLIMESGGLGIRISNEKTFVWRYNFEGKGRWYTIGIYPTWSLSDARAEVEKQRTLLKKGIDPGAKKLEEKQAYVDAPTIKNLIQEFYDRELSKIKSGDATKRLLEKDLIESWGNRRAKSITGRQIVLLLDKVEKRAPVTRNRLKTAISQLFNFAVMRGILDANPCPKIKNIDEKTRNRVLNDDEIVLLWRALDVENERILDAYPITKLALKLILLTGQRPGEVAGMEHTELVQRNDGHWWEIPAKRMKGKNAMAHDVPLTPLALEAINQAKKYSGKSKYIFRSIFKKDSPISVPGISRAVSRHLADMKIDKFTPHDLRRTCRTGLATLKVSDVVAEKILSHKLQGVLGVYNRATYEPERRAALELWEKHISSLVNPEPKNEVETITDLNSYRVAKI
ncbi:MAG: integrase arm-type DNA-binding domain-containing protein [Proteobacteria bacterium]|nr:integrase arm-type DNA-binding domain-containing protein [Pseudomonadota bacterium]MBU4131526.1 integrase arm-type DNA-binding domain-containing protein [Pseudomonadota bacterium]